MSEDGEAGAPGAPPEQPFEVVIDAEGVASIDGEQVPVIGDQPLDTAILDTLHGYARLRGGPVTASISNPATGATAHVEVDPDGSSRLAGPEPDPSPGGTPVPDSSSADAPGPAGAATGGEPPAEGAPASTGTPVATDEPPTTGGPTTVDGPPTVDAAPVVGGSASMEEPPATGGPATAGEPPVAGGPSAGQAPVPTAGPAVGGSVPPGHSPVVGDGSPVQGSAVGKEVGAVGSEGAVGTPGPAAGGPAKGRSTLSSIPRPSLPSIPRPAVLGRSSGGGGGTSGPKSGKGIRGLRGSDVEFVPTSLLKKPWVMASVAVTVVALVITPLAVVGASGQEGKGSDGKTLADGKKDKATRGPSGTVRPSRPSFPGGSPSPGESDEDSTDDPKLGDSDPADKGDKDDKGGRGSSDDKPSGDDKGNDTNKAAGGPVIPSGVTMIQNRRTGQCLDLPGKGKGKPDGPAMQGACDTTHAALGGNQRWKLDLKQKDGGPGSADLYLIRNVKDNLCLDLAGYGPVAARAKVSEYHCRAKGDNQLWWFDKRSNGTYWIRNKESGHLCLDVAGAAVKKPARLLIFGCDDADDHQWTFRKP